jgi:transcriptional regulator with XRE-family HTH domain
MTLYSTRWASFIRSKRTRLNLTIVEFAVATGVHFQYIVQMEKGRVPTWETVRAMVESLKKRFPEEDIHEWFKQWANAHLEDMNLTIEEICHPDTKAPSLLPPELEISLRKIMTNRKIYPVAVKVLSALAEG